MNHLALLEEINRNYTTTYASRFCTKCSHYRAFLIATAEVPVTGEKVVREECTECHQGESILKTKEPSL